ncbi:enoyl-CoA hydratase-related protein [Bernardetia sp. MNP-M8]|uniref:enoyl-CoA hydratase/isomerase family protein n=1 Tax=Bernardetia sp. MNP-M8 TaxID=3127470 RepID=UPI0030D4E16C
MYTNYEVKNRIAFITLNRPEKRNAFSDELVEELKTNFSKAENDSTVKVIVLKANGDVFCAGADLGYLQTLQTNSYQENLGDSSSLKDLYEQIYMLSKPTVAQVQGHALAGGCGLVSVCDFVFSVPKAKYGYTEVKIGFVPAIVMYFLIRKIGEARARHLLISGNLIKAEKAEQYGIVTEIVEAEDLEQTVLDFCQNICDTNSAQAMALTKQAILDVQEKTIPDALRYAAELNAKARMTEDCKKGIGAFLNKEKISW